MLKPTRILLVLAVLTQIGLTQTATKKPVPATAATDSTLSKPVAGTATKQAPVPKAGAATASPKPKTAAKKVAVQPAPMAKPSAAKTATAVAEPKMDAQAEVAKIDAKRRDPFVNPMQLQEDKLKNTAACTTGARCLMIDQVVLQGVVKTQNGMIAMVENAAKKQYNLREKDPVYNGFVLKITNDSVVFRENSVDNLGRNASKEVVKRVTVPPV